MRTGLRALFLGHLYLLKPVTQQPSWAVSLLPKFAWPLAIWQGLNVVPPNSYTEPRHQDLRMGLHSEMRPS